MNRKAKICHISSVHPALDIRIFHKECKSLAKTGYDVVIIAQHDKTENVDGLSIIALPKPRNRFHRMFGITSKLLILAIKQNADIYHFHDTELIPIGLILKLLGKKVVYDVHENNPESILTKTYIPKYFRKSMSVGVWIIERIFSRFFNLIIASTDSVRQNFSNKHSIVIHNYPFITDLKKTKEEKDNFFRIIYPGPICELRGISQLFRALECLNNDNIKLILIGNFVSKSYEDYARSLEIWKQIEYMGILSHREVMISLSKADLGVECSLPAPNYLYSESNKIFEYMSVGIPVLCSNLPRIQEIVEGSNSGICVDPLNIQAIADCIKFLASNQNLRENMGENGRKAILEKYNWNIEEEKLLKAYKLILGEIK